VTRTTTSSPRRSARPAPLRVDHHKRWRPRDRRGGVCGYAFRAVTCARRGAHHCVPRADRVVTFFSSMLRHTVGAYRRQAFVLEDWQEHEIIRPLFGEVLWSPEWNRYVRRYRIAYLVMGRKNGKSEIASGLQLYMLIGDDEEGAEVYIAAKDKDQADKIFAPATRMVAMQPRLKARLQHIKNAMRLIDAHTGSIYRVLTADAAGELGHNPHNFHLDEVLSQLDGSLWDAMTTAVGARTQELISATTTETSDDASFGAALIDEADRVMENPAAAPHIFAYVRRTPKTVEELERLHRIFPGHPHLPISADPWDERNWKWANPALGTFKSVESMRRQALDAQGDRRKENAFRQFQLNQRVQASYRYIPLDLWDASVGELAIDLRWLEPKLTGKRCWGGLDLSSKLDLTASALLFEDEGWVRWRYWVPESMVAVLDEYTDGAFGGWVAEGWVTATEGDTIDYDQIYQDWDEDHGLFSIANITYDKWCGEPVRQEIASRTGLELYESATTYERMTGPMTEFMRMLKAGELRHGGNPVARWNAEHLAAKSPADDPDRIRPVKPNRDKARVRVDGIPALLFAIDGRMRQPVKKASVYETRGLMSL